MFKLFKTFHLIGLAAGLGGLVALLAHRSDGAQTYGLRIVVGLAVSGLSGAAMMAQVMQSPFALDTIEQILGRAPRSLPESIDENAALFS